MFCCSRRVPETPVLAGAAPTERPLGGILLLFQRHVSSPSAQTLHSTLNGGMEKIIHRNVWGALKPRAPRERPMRERGRAVG
ncbi:uncharacterized [Tachysurus ichikawai]